MDYNTLRTSLKRADAGYATNAESDLPRSELTKVSRLREVLHVGVKLCDARMGTAEQIQILVRERTRAIESETSSFIPNAFEINELDKSPDTSFVEQLAEMEVGSLANRASLVDFDIEQNLELDSSDNWETDSDTSAMHLAYDDSVESREMDNSASPPPSVDQPLTFQSLLVELQDALADFEETYFEDANTFDYRETQKAFKEGIRLSVTPRKGQTPEKIWKDVEEQVIQNARMASIRHQLMAPRGSGQSYQSHHSQSLDAAGADEEDEDEDVRRMVAEIAEEEEGEDDEEMLVPDTPTRVPVRKGQINITHHSPNEDALMSVGRREQRSSNYNAPASTFELAPWNPALQLQHGNVSTAGNMSSQPSPAEGDRLSTHARSVTASVEHNTDALPHADAPSAYTFSPIEHDGAPMTTVPPIMQKFYRSTVQHTLEELLNSTTSDEVRQLLHAYWEHVEKEVPAPALEQPQANLRPGWLRTAFRNSSPRDVNRNGWR